MGSKLPDELSILTSLQCRHGRFPQLRVIHTVCSHDCPDSCAVLVTVNEEGRAVKVEGDRRSR